MIFKFPQYIDVEDKIFGPLTIKQFIYLLGGAGIIVTIFRFLPGFIAFFLAIPIIALSLSLAFWRVNNQPFISVLESFMKYVFGEKLYIWKKEAKKISKKEQESINPQVYIPKVTDGNLKNLKWNIDVKKSQDIEPET
ncbi:MAG TPA: PrgI family protein [Candidatus Paceibacterota bacterium]